jgi:DNA polymerase-3 subunit delta
VSRAADVPSSVYLIFGEDEFLVEEMLNTLLGKLVAALGEGLGIETVDCEESRADEILAEIVSPSLFAANKVAVLKHIKFGKQRKLVADIEKCVSEGLVPGQVLVLVTSDVDRRLKLVKTVNKMGGLIEVPSMAPEDRERYILKKFRDLGKSASRDVAQLLLDLKDDMRAISTEIEKVATYVGDAGEVGVADVETVVGRSRHEKVYELTRAVITRDSAAALAILAELLDRPDESPIGLLYRISREIRCLIQVRLFLDRTHNGWAENMQFGAFKNVVLPRFEKWVEEAGISRRDSYLWQRPYGVYMRFKEGSGFEVKALVAFLGGLLRANAELVSTSVDPRIILERLISTLGVEGCNPTAAR